MRPNPIATARQQEKLVTSNVALDQSISIGNLPFENVNQTNIAINTKALRHLGAMQIHINQQDRSLWLPRNRHGEVDGV